MIRVIVGYGKREGWHFCYKKEILANKRGKGVCHY